MYDWNQTNTSLTIIIPIPYKVEKKKVDYVITECYVKLNIPEMKRICFIDLADFVDINKCKMIIEENKILFLLTKVSEGLWKELNFKGTKEEVKERRKKAEEKYNEKIKLERETAEKTKRELEKFVTEQSIKIDDAKRELIREKKSEEKNQAEKELYSFVEKIEHQKIKPNTNNIDEDDIPTTDKSKQKIIKHNKEEEKREVVHPKKENNIIFEEKELPIQKESKKEKPIAAKENSFQKAYENITKLEPPKPVSPGEQTQIRQQANIQVNLTEKKIPHFAARESLSKEPPYPKSKKYVPEKNYVRKYKDNLFFLVRSRNRR